MSPIACVILAAGAIGHVVLWVALVNRIHALGIERRWVDLLTLLCVVMFVVMPILAAAVFFGILTAASAQLESVLTRALWIYLVLCAFLLVAAVLQRLLWFLLSDRHGSLLNNDTTAIHIKDPKQSLLKAGIPLWMGRLPGNEVLKACVQERSIAIPRLAQLNEPLRIVHLTDLHMSGRITRKYFERIVDAANALEPDIITLTGDIIERELCIDWIPATLGRLRAHGGVFYVLGNHDRHVDESRLKAALADGGLKHLGAECHQLSIRGVPITLGGNELPWFEPASNFANTPPHDEAGLPLRILLSHSPDQFDWAQANDVDLVLAGHLHGGQVRLPIIGAIFSPSRFGVRYAAGVFTAGKTVMHVSSGTGSLTPLRYNCPPEISLLKLTSTQPQP